MVSRILLCDKSPEIQHLKKCDRRLAKLIQMVGDISYVPHNENAYGFMVHEIIEQMLSIKAGRQIYQRLESMCGGYVCADRISDLSDEQIKSAGMSRAKVSYIRSITEAFAEGVFDDERMQGMSDQEIISTLTSIRGIGRWTAKMYLMFVLDRPDVLPVEDGAFRQVYRWIYKTDGNCSVHPE